MPTSEKMPRPRPLQPDSAMYQSYLAGLSNGSIYLRRCRGCQTTQWPPREICGNCQSSDFADQEVSQEGTVHTFSLIRRAFHPWFADKLPYAVLVVEMQDKTRLLGRYVGEDPESIRIGDRVKAVFESVDESTVTLSWARAAGG